MDLASVFDWFHQDSILAAEQTDEPRKREILLKLASQWAAAAQQCRNEEHALLLARRKRAAHVADEAVILPSS